MDVPIDSYKKNFKGSLSFIKGADEVYFHVANLEQDSDIKHGFSMIGASNTEILHMPGEPRMIRWNSAKSGVFPFYCTDLCSALHQKCKDMSAFPRADLT